jgi:23S rRNA (pseudouridine1915-N3)-methyltransferase
VQIRILSIGRNLPHWINEGFANYAKRMPRECALELIELDAGARVRKRSVPEKIQAEAVLLRNRMEPGWLTVALDERGRSHTSTALAKSLEQWRGSGRNVQLIVGGADGLDLAIRDKAEQCWSLSPLTLPHGLVRVLVAEQLFRAWSILQGHPYHRQ